MSKLHGVSSNVGYVMVACGLIFGFAIFGMIQIISIPEVWEVVLQNTFWSPYLVAGFIFFVCVPALIVLFAYGGEMIKYRDGRIDEIKSIDEKAKDSEYKPEPPKESKDL